MSQFFLPNFKQILIFSTDFRKNPHRNNRPVGAALKYVYRRTGGRMDMAKLMDAFRGGANVSTMVTKLQTSGLEKQTIHIL